MSAKKTIIIGAAIYVVGMFIFPALIGAAASFAGAGNDGARASSQFSLFGWCVLSPIAISGIIHSIKGDD